MKKQFLLIAIMTVLGVSNSWGQKKQDMPNPLVFVKQAVPHGIPIDRWPDFDNMMITTFSKDETNVNIISKEIADSCKKRGINCKYVFRGNMIDYSFSKDSMVMTYHLYIRPQDNTEGNLCIHYQLGKWSSSSDNWMYKNVIAQTKWKVDSREDFLNHANIVAHMMVLDVWIPHLLTTRLSYNLQFGEGYLVDFKKIATRNGLKIKEKDLGIYFSNGYHDYLIVYHKLPQPTFEVTPKWSDTK
jgi:hypothetical protein